MNFIKKIVSLIRKFFNGHISNQVSEIIVRQKYAHCNSTFRHREFEESYKNVQKIMESLQVEWGLFGGSLLSVVRNGYLDPNMYDVDCWCHEKDISKLEEYFSNCEYFRISEKFYYDDKLILLHVYDGRYNIFVDFNTINDKYEMIVPEKGKFTTIIRDFDDKYHKQAFMKYRLFDRIELSEGTEWKEVLNIHTGNTLTFPIPINYKGMLYKHYGEDWDIRMNNYKAYYSVNHNDARIERGYLKALLDKGDTGYKEIYILKDKRLSFIWSDLSNSV